MGRYRGRTFIRERVHVCGEYLDTEIYPVFQAPGKRRKKCRPTRDVQEKINQRNAERRLTRLVHANFTEEDLALGLSYDDAHLVCVDEAKKKLQRFLRILRGEYRKKGLELKYITTTEISKIGRCHHHVILSGGVDRDRIEELWGQGYANSKRLQFGQKGVMGLACYMVKGQINYRRYNCSRNLIRPEPAEFDGRMDRAEQQRLAEMIEDGTIYTEMERVYPDYECVDAECSRNEVNGAYYIRIFMRRKTEALKEKRKERRKKMRGCVA
jgi:hypothetical protein